MKNFTRKIIISTGKWDKNSEMNESRKCEEWKSINLKLFLPHIKALDSSHL